MTISTFDEESVFKVACRLDDADARATYLDQVCGQQVELRRRVEYLLSLYFEQPDFLEPTRTRVPRDTPVSASRKPSGDSGSDGATMQPVTPADPGDRIGTLIDRYLIRERLAEGGMGVVYVAEQTEPVARKVALKVIKPGLSSRDVLARFDLERQSLALMDHPHIARVFDAGTTDAGEPYFVMELVQGVPITQYCDDHCLSIRERLELFAKVCRAVQHAHQKGIIHRDLKPANLLVADIDGEAVPKIIDFGVARAVGEPMGCQTVYTNFAQLIGTPLYMSPEQTTLGVIDIDTRSDVYSLGVLLYEVLTGATPFSEEILRQAGFDEMRRMIQEDEASPPSEHFSTLEGKALSTVADQRRVDSRQLADQLRSELDWIVMKALAKDRNRRYESPGALAADIDRYLQNVAVEACPPTRRYRLKKTIQRHRMPLAVAVVVLLTLGLGLCATIWQANRASRLAIVSASNAQRAQREAKRANQIASQNEAMHATAQANLRLAIATVDDMYRNLATQWLSSDTGLSELQRKYCQKAVDFYGRILAQPQQLDLGDDELAEIALRSALLLQRLDHLEDAQSCLQSITDRYAADLDDELKETSDESLERLATMQNLLGGLAKDLVDTTEAMKRFNAANATCESLVKRPSARVAARVIQASIAANVHHVYWLQQKPELAEASVKEAIRLIDEVRAEGEDPQRYKSEQCEYHADLSEVLIKQGKLAESESVARDALRRVRIALINSPDSRKLREVEQRLMTCTAQNLVARREFGEAESLLQEILDRQVTMLSIGTEPPNYLYSLLIGQNDRFGGAEEPRKWSDWIRTSLLLARVEFELEKPIAAECRLSTVAYAAEYLPKVYPNDVRHGVDLANTYAVTATGLHARYPEESSAYGLAAAKAWLNVLRRSPSVVSTRTGVFPIQEDFSSFIDEFPELDVRQREIEARVEKLPRPNRSLAPRGVALVESELGISGRSTDVLAEMIATRDPPEAIDLLLLTQVLLSNGLEVDAVRQMQQVESVLSPTGQTEEFVLRLRDELSRPLQDLRATTFVEPQE